MNKSLENFNSILFDLRTQHDSDIEYAKCVGEALGVEINPYNNSLLVNNIISMLASWFKNSKEAKFEIDRYIYELNFGRHKGAELITTEILWLRLQHGK